MTQTFNRQPAFVNTPSKDAVKNYFFNHNKFKGLNDDKNFVEVDQDTFQDCKNVFVDAESILRSRHAVKIKIVKPKINGTEVILANVIDVEVFGDTVVYNSTDGTNYYLTFVNSNFQNNVQRDLGTSNEYKLVISEHKIFIFTSTSLYYYDIDTNSILSGTSFIYIPVTKTVRDGVEAEFESPNELTTSYITRYFLNNVSDIDFVTLNNKQVTIKIGEQTYNVTFVDGMQYIYFVNRRALPETAFADKYILGKYGEGTPLVENKVVDGYNITLLCTEETTLGTTSQKIPTCKWDLYWSINSVVYYKLPDKTGILTMPKLSEDGSMACVLCSDGVYVISLVAGEYGTLIYPTWTKLPLNTSHTFNTIVTSGTIPKFNQNVQLGFSVASSTSYSVCFGNTSGTVVCDSSETYVNHTQMTICMVSGAGISSDTNILYSANSTIINPAVQPVLVKSNISYTYVYLAGGERSYTIDGENIDVTFKYLHRYVKSNNNTVLDEAIRENSPSYESSSPLCENIIFVNNDTIIYSLLTILVLLPYITINSYTFSTHTEATIYQNAELVEKTIIDEKSTPTSLSFVIKKFDSTVFYYNGNKITLNYNIIPLSLSNTNITGVYDGYIVNNDLSDQNATIDLFTEGIINYIVPDHFAEVDNYYFSKGNTIYISSLSEYMDGFQWYFPQINTEEFDYPITGLHPISTTELAIFQEDAIYYVVKQYNEQLKLYTYSYFKTRVNIGCKEGCDIITTFDGKYTLFASKRGLVAMSYQEFISSTEQALTYISDSIYSLFEAFNISPIKLYQHGYWIYVYRQDSNYCLVFDIRNSSWWPFMYKYNCTKFLAIDNKTHFICKNQLHSTYDGFGDYESNPQKPYRDVYYIKRSETNIVEGQPVTTERMVKENVEIDWYILSQKLHLNAINYYKHIVNLTLNNVIDKKQKLSFTFTVKNYRTDISKDAIGSIVQEGAFNNGSFIDEVTYTVDTISTFVQRVNFSKVTEFQYKLESNTKIENTQKTNLVALSLANITVKYKIGSQVR